MSPRVKRRKAQVTATLASRRQRTERRRRHMDVAPDMWRSGFEPSSGKARIMTGRPGRPGR
jgi:hypothetical protein